MEQLRWFKPDGTSADSRVLRQRQQPRHRLAHRRQRVRRYRQRDLRRLQRLVGQRELHPAVAGHGKQWYRVTDTATWNEGANPVRCPGAEALIGGEWTVYGVQGRSLLVLIAK